MVVTLTPVELVTLVALEEVGRRRLRLGRLAEQHFVGAGLPEVGVGLQRGVLQWAGRGGGSRSVVMVMRLLMLLLDLLLMLERSVIDRFDVLAGRYAEGDVGRGVGEKQVQVVEFVVDLHLDSAAAAGTSSSSARCYNAAAGCGGETQIVVRGRVKLRQCQLVTVVWKLVLAT